MILEALKTRIKCHLNLLTYLFLLIAVRITGLWIKDSNILQVALELASDAFSLVLIIFCKPCVPLYFILSVINKVTIASLAYRNLELFKFPVSQLLFVYYCDRVTFTQYLGQRKNIYLLGTGMITITFVIIYSIIKKLPELIIISNIEIVVLVVAPGLLSKENDQNYQFNQFVSSPRSFNLNKFILREPELPQKLDLQDDQRILTKGRIPIEENTPLVKRKLWNSRMDSVPVGIAILTTTSIKYANQSLRMCIKKISESSNLNLEITLFQKLKFRLLSQVRQRLISVESAKFKVKTIKNRKGSDHLNQQSGSQKQIRLDDQNITLSQLIKLHSENELKQFYNCEENAFEMVCNYQNKVHLTCKLLVQAHEIQLDKGKCISQRSKMNIRQRYRLDKKKLISSFSHELRTPLNSAILFLRACLANENHVDYKSKYIEPCLGSLILQECLIQDVIDFSQINANLMDLKINSFYISEVIDQIVEMFRFQISTKGLGLAFEVDPKVPYQISTDQKRLMQILVNLINNSIKFAVKGYILIRITYGEMQHIEFSVQDEGVGIQQIELENLQKSLNLDNNPTWTGFGLIICQMLIRELGSTLEIDSKGDGKGTVVKFSIINHRTKEMEMDYLIAIHPRIHLHRSNSVPVLNKYTGLMLKIRCSNQSQLILKPYDIKTGSQMNNDLFDVPQENISSMITNNLQGMCNTFNFIDNINRRESEQPQCSCNKILSVDDEVFNQTSLKYLLSQMGFKVHQAYNGQQALEILRSKEQVLCGKNCRMYKCILMDCSMPVMDGWRASKHITKMIDDGTLPRIPLIGLTAFTSKHDIEECLKSGMLEVLQKPLSVKKFQEILLKLQIL